MTSAEKVVARFLETNPGQLSDRLAFKYQPKESKKSKVDRLMRLITDQTGIGRGVAKDIADAIIRGRDVLRLAIQKGWPVVEGAIEGPRGTYQLNEAMAAV